MGIPDKRTKATVAMTLMLLTAAGVLAQEKSESPGVQDGREFNRRILVSIPDRKLALMEDGRVVKVYRTAVGAPASPSPTGTFSIANRIPDPTYYRPGEIIPPGEANPLGTRWLGLSLKGFGIHGTNVPRSIGRAASHGCIRMRNEDVEELFELVRVGDRVELYEQRYEELAQIFGPPELPASELTSVRTSTATGQ